tara:strand:+ start:43258 stop:43419 length:162 start_codon:yes stop_codon:yes gene_type:complete
MNQQPVRFVYLSALKNQQVGQADCDNDTSLQSAQEDREHFQQGCQEFFQIEKG